MSDMLQLVVETGITQAMVIPLRRTLKVPNLHDKLKHVGHLVASLNGENLFELVYVTDRRVR